MTAVVVFDLDGTLVDSLADLSGAVNTMLSDEGLPPLPDDTIRGFVGNGLPKLVERVILHCGLPPHHHPRLTQAALAHYNAATCVNTTVYPGVIEALVELTEMGCALGVCTNKPEAPAEHVLSALNLSEYFKTVIGGDRLKSRKPNPVHLHACFDALPQVGPCIFVGDSEVDAETAERADVPFLLFSEGYRKSPVAEIPHSFAYADSSEIPSLVRRIHQDRSSGL